MWPFARWGRWRRKRQRNIDRGILFPAIRAQQQTWEEGTILILRHVANAEAWRFPDEYPDEALELPHEYTRAY